METMRPTSFGAAAVAMSLSSNPCFYMMVCIWAVWASATVPPRTTTRSTHEAPMIGRAGRCRDGSVVGASSGVVVVSIRAAKANDHPQGASSRLGSGTITGMRTLGPSRWGRCRSSLASVRDQNRGRRVIAPIDLDGEQCLASCEKLTGVSARQISCSRGPVRLPLGLPGSARRIGTMRCRRPASGRTMLDRKAQPVTAIS
jgi:hypothetical protein